MTNPDLTQSQTSEPPTSDATKPYHPSGAGEEVARILDQYLADLEAGRAPPREKLLSEYPDLAAQLEPCLSGMEFIHRAARSRPETPPQLGDFQIVREVGRGGMGVVYEAQQISLKRKVALKVLRFGGVADREAMERFQREAETIAQLHHTSIVPVFAIGNEQGISYYAMQYIEGRSLAAVSEESRDSGMPLDAAEVAEWGLQAADALAHAHQRGVIHRDVKPSNLILDPDGRIWLTDFGLAKRLDDVALSMAGALLGTPRYMSPEQASATRLPVDQRTDIYSLGVTLYELATGRPVFDADTPHGVIAQILTAEPQAPRRVRAGLPRDLETIILKCLAKEPAKRYSTAQEMADDLRAFQQGWPIKARRVSAGERAARWVRRQHRSVALAAAAAAVAVLLVFGGTAAWWSYHQSRLGHMVLTTDGPSLTAEIIPENGDAPVVPSMSVPSQEPVTLPEGRYRLRLSASGLLSETWPLEIQRGSRPSLEVRLHSQWLWPPMNILNEDRPAQAIELKGRADLITVRTVKSEGNSTVVIRRLDGATGKPAWPADLEFDESSLPGGGDARQWRSVVSRGAGTSMPDLLQPAIDLDGDGTRDLIWVSRTSASLVSVSGKEGKPLWWFLGRAAPKDRPLAGEYGHQGSVLGLPAVADIDGDKTPDLVACFLSAREAYATESGTAFTDPQAWVEAVSGRTGKSLWRHVLSHSQPAQLQQHVTGILHGSSTGRTDELVCQPEIVRVKGRQVVAMVLDKRLWGVDLSTGKEAWPARDVGLDLLRPPQLGDWDGDGRPHALLTGRRNQDDLLMMLSLETDQATWNYSFRPFASFSIPGRAARDWPVAADLDGDGRAEIVIPVLNDGADRWAGVELLDAASGEVRWQRRLQRSGMFQPMPIHRIIDGPDLDGDGCREVFAAFSGQDQGGRSTLTVVALSGRHGETLWRWKRVVAHASLADEAGPLQWHHAGVDGWPQLVVPMDSGPGSQPMTFLLSASTGRLAQTLPEVANPRLADFDGDGIADVFYHQASTTGSESYGKLVVLRGALPEPWRQLGRWTPAQDFDGDGVVDLLGDDGTARSGEDGRFLWRMVIQSPSGNPFLSPPLPHGDLDSDGTPDVLALEHVQRRVASNAFTTGLAVSAYSGKDGRKLWIEDFGMSGGGFYGSGPLGEHRYPCLDWCDLDQDGRAEVFVAYSAANNSEILLAALSGQDGGLLWSAPCVAGGFPLANPRHRPQLADLDGDRVLDPVMWAPNRADASAQSSVLVALNGANGRPLWPSSPAIVQKGAYGITRAAAGDLDGDGKAEVLVIRTDHDAQGRPAGHLMALDGRDGREKWAWSWTMQGFATLPPPLLVDLDGSGRLTVCACIQEKGERQIVVLGPDGQVRERIPLKVAVPSNPYLQTSVPWWAPSDLDGDGREEILFLSDNQLWASRGSAASTLWKWPLSKEGMAIHEVRQSNRDRPATVVVQAGRSLLGLSGLSGRPLWRSEVGLDPISMVWAADPARQPRVCIASKWATVCRQTWPTETSGQYAQVTPAAVHYEIPLCEDVRALPWRGDHAWLLVVPAIGGMCLVLVVLPGLAVAQAALRDSWMLGLLGALGGMLGILLCFRDTEILLGMTLLTALAVPGQFAYWALRRKSLQLYLLVLTGVAVVLGAFLFKYRAPPYQPGLLRQLGIACMSALLMSAAAIPVAAFVGMLVVQGRRRHWASIGVLLGFSVAVSLALAALMLALDARWRDPAEQYVWSGWYMVWVLGAYATGALALLGLAFRGFWRRLRTWLRERSGKQLALLLAALVLLLLVVVALLILALSPFVVMHVEQACGPRVILQHRI